MLWWLKLCAKWRDPGGAVELEVGCFEPEAGGLYKSGNATGTTNHHSNLISKIFIFPHWVITNTAWGRLPTRVLFSKIQFFNKATTNK